MAKVLVVDDDATVREVVVAYLRAAGHEVSQAVDGVGALETVRASGSDLVVLDVMMPGLDGWGVLERLEDPLPAVIVVSGLATDQDQHYLHAVELGALGFVSKPFDSTKLLELVETAAQLDAEQRVAFREWLLSGSPEAE